HRDGDGRGQSSDGRQRDLHRGRYLCRAGDDARRPDGGERERPGELQHHDPDGLRQPAHDRRLLRRERRPEREQREREPGRQQGDPYDGRRLQNKPSKYGEAVTFTATVTSAGSPVTVGSVTFFNGGTCASPGATLAGPLALNGSGQASFTISTLTAVGSPYTILGCYGGAANFSASSGSFNK